MNLPERGAEGLLSVVIRLQGKLLLVQFTRVKGGLLHGAEIRWSFSRC